MLKIMMLRKKLEMLKAEETQLRNKQNGFKTREGEIAAQVAAASTDAEVSAAAAAVEELEAVQKTTKERLQTIADECAALIQEIEEAEAAAGAAGDGDGGSDGEARSRRSSGADFQKRCRELKRTGRIAYDDVRSLVKRAAVLTTSPGVVGPTGVSGINDRADSTVSGFIDLIKVTDCTGMSSYKVAYVDSLANASDLTEGQIPQESAPGFGVVELKPESVGLIDYISEDVRDQSPLLYEEKVREIVRGALRQSISGKAIEKCLASPLNTILSVKGASGAALFTPHLLSDIILAYGGDEGVDGAAVLVLSKKDLQAFAAVRGKNEYLPVYSIIPDTENPSMGVIKDNNGLSCRYCLNKHVPDLSTATLSASGTKTMFYGNPRCAEMAVWGGVNVTVNEGYKFAEGLLTIKGKTTLDVDVTVKNGFVVVTGATA